uniref:Helix-rich mycoplasma protein n=1 Tax=Thelephora ganbajun TaxID=370292 RepID=A0A343B752_THEGA|nr:helix-rich mycoplasma protein [Thelephora ganbajun]
MRTTRFFQGLSLTTFSMGVFNTLRGNKTSVLEEQINKHETKYQELNNKYTSLLENNLNKLETEREIIEESNNLKKDVEVLEQKLRNSVEIKRELQTKYSESSGDTSINEKIQEVVNTDEEIHNMYESVNNKFDSFINKINTLLNNSDNKSQYFDSLQSFFDGLNYEQNLAIVHISGSMFILFSLISIISIFYGEKLIIFFDLENRFPKIAKFIQIRRKFQQYYFLINIGLIIIVLTIIIYINIIEFMSNMK